MPDLTPCQPEPAEKVTRVERRAWVRYPYHHDISFEVSGGSGVLWSAGVQNISAGGIGLVLHRRFEPGTRLVVALQGKDGGDSRKVLVRVVHDTLITAHPGLLWLVGCAFADTLSDAELQALLD